MEIFGIGMPELIFIFVIAIIVMGPKDMQKAGKTVGKFLRKIVTSDGWRIFQQTSHELRTLPNKLMREANEDLEQINKIARDVNPFDTLNEKYPKNQPAVSVAPSGKVYPAPMQSQPIPMPAPETAPSEPRAKIEYEEESDSQPDA